MKRRTRIVLILKRLLKRRHCLNDLVLLIRVNFLRQTTLVPCLLWCHVFLSDLLQGDVVLYQMSLKCINAHPKPRNSCLALLGTQILEGVMPQSCACRLFGQSVSSKASLSKQPLLKGEPAAFESGVVQFASSWPAYQLDSSRINFDDGHLGSNVVTPHLSTFNSVCLCACPEGWWNLGVCLSVCLSSAMKRRSTLSVCTFVYS